MQVVSFIVALLLDVRAHIPNVRAHIPNQPSFGSDPARAAYGTSLVRAIAAFFVSTAFLSAALWLAVRLAMELL
jgi:hypothetical protein